MADAEILQFCGDPEHKDWCGQMYRKYYLPVDQAKEPSCGVCVDEPAVLAKLACDCYLGLAWAWSEGMASDEIFKMETRAVVKSYGLWRPPFFDDGGVAAAEDESLLDEMIAVRRDLVSALDFAQRIVEKHPALFVAPKGPIPLP